MGSIKLWNYVQIMSLLRARSTHQLRTSGSVHWCTENFNFDSVHACTQDKVCDRHYLHSMHTRQRLCLPFLKRSLSSYSAIQSKYFLMCGSFIDAGRIANIIMFSCFPLSVGEIDRFTSFCICWNAINADLPPSSVVWESWRSHQPLPFRTIVNVCHHIRIFRSQVLMLDHLTISFSTQKGSQSRFPREV